MPELSDCSLHGPFHLQSLCKYNFALLNQLYSLITVLCTTGTHSPVCHGNNVRSNVCHRNSALCDMVKNFGKSTSNLTLILFMMDWLLYDIPHLWYSTTANTAFPGASWSSSLTSARTHPKLSSGPHHTLKQTTPGALHAAAVYTHACPSYANGNLFPFLYHSLEANVLFKPLIFYEHDGNL